MSQSRYIIQPGFDLGLGGVDVLPHHRLRCYCEGNYDR